MTPEKYLQYEKVLKGDLWWSYSLIAFVVIVMIGLVIFVIWWRVSERKQREEFNVSEEAKVDKKVVFISAILITSVVIGALHSAITSILQVHHDLQNKSYIVVDTAFTVTQTDLGGRWRSTSYTVSYEKDGVNIEIYPNLKSWALPAGTYTDKVLVYALRSEIVVDVYPHDEQ